MINIIKVLVKHFVNLKDVNVDDLEIYQLTNGKYAAVYKVGFFKFYLIHFDMNFTHPFSKYFFQSLDKDGVYGTIDRVNKRIDYINSKIQEEKDKILKLDKKVI